MFKEDFHQNIVPLYDSNYGGAKCELEPSNEKLQNLISELFPSHHQSFNKNLNDIILGAIQFIAQNLVHNGYLVFEFVTLKEINDQVKYKLVGVYGEKVKIKRKKIIQVLHYDATEQQNKSRHIDIPLKKCFVFEYPKSLGGKEKYLKFLNEFEKFAKQSPMMTYLRNPLVEQDGYDLTKHQQLHQLELWKKSKRFNWHHRGNYDELFSRYYYIYRRLQFQKSTIHLRDYIIGQLDEIIKSISLKFGNKTELKITGLVSLNRVDEVLKHWKTGEVKPEELKEILW